MARKILKPKREPPRPRRTPPRPRDSPPPRPRDAPPVPRAGRGAPPVPKGEKRIYFYIRFQELLQNPEQGKNILENVTEYINDNDLGTVEKIIRHMTAIIVSFPENHIGKWRSFKKTWSWTFASHHGNDFRRLTEKQFRKLMATL